MHSFSVKEVAGLCVHIQVALPDFTGCNCSYDLTASDHVRVSPLQVVQDADVQCQAETRCHGALPAETTNQHRYMTHTHYRQRLQLSSKPITVNLGYNDIGYNDISHITTYRI